MPESDAILPAYPVINVFLPQECYFCINEMKRIFEIDANFRFILAFLFYQKSETRDFLTVYDVVSNFSTVNPIVHLVYRPMTHKLLRMTCFRAGIASGTAL